VQSWKISSVVSFIIGTAIAAAVTFMTPAAESDNFFYLMLCGVVAVCSMILPGLSGSFVLILMGNYQLVAINAINNRELTILVPVLIGAVAGLIAFSHFLSWLLKTYKDQTIALLTGFILGSLSILWPWKKAVYLKDTAGELLLKDGLPKVARYIPEWPAELNQEVLFSALLMIAGILTIWAVEYAAQTKKPSSETAS